MKRVENGGGLREAHSHQAVCPFLADLGNTGTPHQRGFLFLGITIWPIVCPL